MKVYIGDTSGTWVERLSSLLSIAGVGLAPVAKALEPLDSDCTIIYARPEYTAEAALLAGENVDATLSQWEREATLILDLFRRSNSKVQIVHGPSILANPDQFFSLVGTEAAVDYGAVGGRNPPSEPAGLVSALAAQLVASRPEVTDAAGELEAATVFLDGRPPVYVTAFDEAQEELRSLWEARDRLQAEISRATALEQEKEALRSDLDAVSSEAQFARERSDTLEAELASEREDLARDNARVEQENALLLSQLNHVQKELEEYYVQTIASDRAHSDPVSAAAIDDLVSYSLMLEHLYLKVLRSRTWKAMAPVRLAIRSLKGLLRGRRPARNRLPDRPAALGDQPLGGFFGKRSLS